MEADSLALELGVIGLNFDLQPFSLAQTPLKNLHLHSSYVAAGTRQGLCFIETLLHYSDAAADVLCDSNLGCVYICSKISHSMQVLSFKFFVSHSGNVTKYLPSYPGSTFQKNNK